MALGFSLQGWLRYRYMRAALDTLKTYAANGRDPPEALVKALTESHWPPNTASGGWGWGPGPNGDDEPYAQDTRSARAAYRARWRHRRHNSALYAWRQAIFWAALTAGFWFAAEYVQGGDAHNSLTIVAIITGAITVAALLGALMTTIVRASGNPTD
jgi:hypothetical protein